MTNSISSFISAQIPEYLNDTDSLFTEFLETYYRYCQLRENAVGLILNHSDNLDVDNTLDKYIEKFYASYGILVPKEMAIDKRTFLKLLNNLYESKGTEKSFKYLFRLLFNTNIDIYQPSQQMMKASDGQWEQQSFITIYGKFGVLTDLVDITTEISNYTGTYSINIDRIETIQNSRIRVYFKKTEILKITDGTVLNVYKQGDLIYRADVEKSPTRISISKPGNKFQVGQIYKITGIASNTIFKVTTTTPSGGIKSVAILHHGDGHIDSQQSYVSSYKTVPPNNGSSVSTEETSPGVYTHSINAFDIIYGIVERMTWQQIGINEQSYFAQDYVQLDYFGNTLFDQYLKNSSEPTTSNLLVDVNTSFSQYMADRARVILNFDYIASTPGRYVTNSGHISDQFIRLQDSKYYQIFSYVIKSKIDISRYKDTVLKMLHPAGTVAYASLQHDYYLDISDNIFVDGKYIYRLNFDEATYIFDNLSKIIGKNEVDTSIGVESVAKSFSTPVFENMATQDYISKSFGSNLFDTQNIVEYSTKSFNKIYSENTNASYAIDYFGENYNENESTEDYISKSFGSHLFDTQNIVEYSTKSFNKNEVDLSIGVESVAKSFSTPVFENGLVADNFSLTVTPASYAINYFGEIYNENIPIVL